MCLVTIQHWECVLFSDYCHVRLYLLSRHPPPSTQAHTARPSVPHSDPAPKRIQVPVQWSHLATDPEGQAGQTRPQLHQVRLSALPSFQGLPASSFRTRPSPSVFAYWRRGRPGNEASPSHNRTLCYILEWTGLLLDLYAKMQFKSFFNHALLDSSKIICGETSFTNLFHYSLPSV